MHKYLTVTYNEGKHYLFKKRQPYNVTKETVYTSHTYTQMPLSLHLAKLDR